MKASALPVPAPVETYGVHWFLLLLAGGLLAGGLWWQAMIDREGSLPPLAVPRGEADWFLAVRMPETGPGEAAVQRTAAQVDSWLAVLRSEGFKPILISEALRRLRRREGLPEKSVALIFDPGTRRTWEALAPVLANHRWPAAWLTDGEALRRKDRRYVSAREARDMARSGWWDVGLRETRPTARMEMRTPAWKAFPLAGRGGLLWADQDGKYALNAGEPHRLRRLNANLSWSGQELVDRLMSERPLTRPSRLGLRQIRDMRWGVVEDLSAPAAFELAAPVDRRGDAVYWLGTRGIPDLEVDLKVESLTGELWLLLRSDERAGEAVRVAFTDGSVVLEEERGGSRDVVGGADAPALAQPSSFTASVRLRRDRLEVWVNGRPCAAADGLSVTGSPESLARLMIYEKVLGAARAASVEITAAPAGEEEAAPNTAASPEEAP